MVADKERGGKKVLKHMGDLVAAKSCTNPIETCYNFHLLEKERELQLQHLNTNTKHNTTQHYPSPLHPQEGNHRANTHVVNFMS
jgi:hypothetical protein